MENIGEVLRQAREEKAFSIEQLQEKTKIQKRYLIAIENNQFDLLPGKFYVRAFIRLYAEEVGLNLEALMKEYGSQLQLNQKDDEVVTFSRVQTQRSVPINDSKWLERLPKIALALFIIALSFFIYFLVSKYNLVDNTSKGKDDDSGQVYYEETDKNKGKKDELDKEDEDEKTPEETGKVDDLPKQSITLLSTDGKTSVFEVRNATGFLVKVASSGSAWVSLTKVNNEVAYQGTLRSPDFQEIDLTGNQEVTVVTGKAAETQLFVNGEEVLFNTNNLGNVRQTITIKLVQ